MREKLAPHVKVHHSIPVQMLKISAVLLSTKSKPLAVRNPGWKSDKWLWILIVNSTFPL